MSGDEATEDEFNTDRERKDKRETYVSPNVLIPSQTSCVIVTGRAEKLSDRK
jgi:hypothetical protein